MPTTYCPTHANESEMPLPTVTLAPTTTHALPDHDRATRYVRDREREMTRNFVERWMYPNNGTTTRNSDDLPDALVLRSLSWWQEHEEMRPHQVALLRGMGSFLRRNCGGAYRDRTFQTIEERATALEAEDMWAGTTPAPTGIMLEAPYEFDEDTEQKTGGILAVALMLPSLDPDVKARWLCATAPTMRRKGLMKALFTEAFAWDVNPRTVVAPRNTAGMQCAIACGLRPVEVKRNLITFAKKMDDGNEGYDII